MELTVLGCSGSYGAPAGGACSGYLVRSGTTALWLDCGSGTLANLQRHIPLEDVTAAVVSHRHPDHCTDLYGLHVALRYGLKRTGFPVLAAPEVLHRMSSLSGTLTKVFDWDEVGDGDERSVGDVRLRFSRTDHIVPTLAVELADGDKRLVYTADTGPEWDVSAFGAGADLVLSEASYQRDHQGDPHHLTAEQAGRFAAEAGARRLVITHLWPTLDPAVSVAEAEDGFGGAVTLAAPHLQVKV